MKKIHLLLLIPFLLISFLQSCVENSSAPDLSLAKNAGLELGEKVACNDLELFPILADESLLNEQQSIANFKTLAQAMDMQGFRITERKEFGRNSGHVINALTVQNKTRDTIILLSGDVVTGGNQDRVIAHSEVLPPKTIKNIEVFCVEKDRWTYYDQDAAPGEKSLGAFKGYFSMASPSVRKAVNSGGQKDVWSAVARVTESNGARSRTKTYAALEKKSEQWLANMETMDCLTDKIRAQEGVVGVIALYQGQHLGTDVFGHSTLLDQHLESLIKGYFADMARLEGSGNSADNRKTAELELSKAGRKIAGKNSERMQLNWNGNWIHLHSH